MHPGSEPLHALLMNLFALASLLHPDETAPAGTPPLSQVLALHALDTEAPLSQRDLARRLHLEKSTVSRLVAEMEHSGLLVRDRDPENRRFYRLLLTRRGRAAHARMATRFHGRFQRLLAGMTVAERSQLRTALPALLRALHDELNRQ